MSLYIPVPSSLSPEVNQSDWRRHWFIFILLLTLFVGTNRVLTLFITFTRAKGIHDAQRLSVGATKSTRRIYGETALFGIGGGLVLWCVIGLVSFLTKKMFVAVIPASALLGFLMLSATIFIVVRLKCRNREDVVVVESKGHSSAVEDEFKKLCILVAIVYTFCCMGKGVAIAPLVFKGPAISSSKLWFWDNVVTIFNSWSNLFIYVIASSNFRRVLISGIKSKSPLIVLFRKSDAETSSILVNV